MVCSSGQYPGSGTDLEVGLRDPQGAGNRKFRKRLALDAVHFVYDETETVTHVDDSSGNPFTRFAGEDQAGCFAVDADAQAVYFQFGLLFGDKRTDFQHVGL